MPVVEVIGSIAAQRVLSEQINAPRSHWPIRGGVADQGVTR